MKDYTMVKVEREQHTRLKELAKQEDRTMISMLNKLLENYKKGK